MKKPIELLGKMLPFLALLVALGGGIFLYLASAKTVLIVADGERSIVRTHAKTVGAALPAAQLGSLQGAKIYPDLSSALNDQDVIEIELGHPVVIDIDGQSMETMTAEKIPANILASIDIALLPGDRIWVDGIPFSDAGKALERVPSRICLRRARQVPLEVDGQEVILSSAAPTLGEALEEAGIKLYEGDLLEPGPETPLRGLTFARLIHSRPITISVDGNLVASRVVAQTVGEALLKAEIALIGLDYSLPIPTEALPDDGHIEVIRVREDVIIEQTPLPFTTAYEAAPELEIDSTAILDRGSYGVQARRIRVRYENGEEVSRTIEGEWTAREPTARKVGYGTKIVIRTLETADGPIQYWRALKMYATSYSPSRSGTSPDAPWYGKTACGKTLVKGLVGIDNRYIPFHTMMYVPGYGYAEACDTGGGVIGRWIDLGYEDHNYRTWHQWVTVYFLTPVPPANSITWVFP
jgi:uncharacterized protein YabE (DUF348 family)